MLHAACYLHAGRRMTRTVRDAMRYDARPAVTCPTSAPAAEEDAMQIESEAISCESNARSCL